MSYFMSLMLIGVVIGLIAVASNPSPYYAALGLVGVAIFGCGVLSGYGGSFLCLVFFFIYLGGMLVVFAYSAALAAEPFPVAWGDQSVIMSVLGYLVFISMLLWYFSGCWYVDSWASVNEFKDFTMYMGDISGVSLMYSFGGGMLVVGAWILLVTLFVVLELTRGLGRGALRAV
uniref:NADH-ubiquinone oxidoreductase chain 6 n=1 Tax=Aphredoderus sayanus TaxID=94919 RepID=Q8HMJ7_9TELE|nr:NADH dehydrogenase subunit 6 [Aphredoderus sayanus]BAC23162.1 NADH dehydrogenase subunit 6 [Aphredoderus sayanus]